MGIPYTNQVVPEPSDDGGTFRIAGAVERAGGCVGTYVPLEDDGEEDVVPEALLQGLNGDEVDLLMLDLQGTTVMLAEDGSLEAPVNLSPPMLRATPVTPVTAPPRQRSGRNRMPSMAPTGVPLPSEVPDDDLLDLAKLKDTPARPPVTPSEPDPEELSADLSVPSDPRIYAAFLTEEPAGLTMPAPSVPAPVQPKPTSVSAPTAPSSPEPIRAKASAWAAVTGLFKSVFPG